MSAVVTTARLALRHLDADRDATFMFELVNDPAFLQNIGDRGVRTVDDARAYLTNGAIASYARHGFGLYLVTSLATGASLGICGLVKRDTLDDVDLGFAFLPAHRALGYATESASAVVTYARSTLGLKRLVAIVQPENAASIRVLEKVGFRFERLARLSADDVELAIYADSASPGRIRFATPADAAPLTDLARRAKASWGYPEEWLTQWQGELTLTADYLARHQVLVAEDDAGLAGCCALEDHGARWALENVWVAPERQGQGFGRALVERALALVAEQRPGLVTVLSDPHAVPFYLKLGAEEVGRQAAPMPGMPNRVLPVLHVMVGN